MNKNYTFIIAGLLILLMPSCMMNKCRYSSGWKIDLSTGGKKHKQEELKADVAHKKSGMRTAAGQKDSTLVLQGEKNEEGEGPVIGNKQLKTRVKKKSKASDAPLIQTIVERKGERLKNDKTSINHIGEVNQTASWSTAEIVILILLIGIIAALLYFYAIPFLVSIFQSAAYKYGLVVAILVAVLVIYMWLNNEL